MAIRPMSAIMRCISGAAVMALSSRCKTFTTAGGVPAGATIRCHDTASNPASPLSAIGGTSGSTGTRVSDDTPSARTRPSLIAPIAESGDANVICTWPAMTSVMRLRHAAIGDMGHLDAGHALEQLAGHVRHRAGAGRGVGELLRLRELDEIADRLHRQ